MSLLLRIFLLNAAVFAAAVIALAVTPATVSTPVSWGETLVLAAGFMALLLANLMLLRRALAPLQRLAQSMETVELLRPGGRLPTLVGNGEVASLTRSFNEMLDRLEQERRDSVRRSLAAQEAERQRVAQELHDEIGQSLTAVLLQIDRVARGAPGELRPGLEEARETARGSLDEMRAVARRLRPEALDFGIADALEALCRRLSQQGRLPIRQRLDRDLPELPPEAELVIYRIAQEALTNTLRHADAGAAEVVLQRHGQRLRLCVRDDGRGLEGASPGAGIQGMRERALLVGGDFELREHREGGAEVRLDYDLEADYR